MIIKKTTRHVREQGCGTHLLRVQYRPAALRDTYRYIIQVIGISLLYLLKESTVYKYAKYAKAIKRY